MREKRERYTHRLRGKREKEIDREKERERERKREREGGREREGMTVSKQKDVLEETQRQLY